MCGMMDLVRLWSILDYAGRPLSRDVVSDAEPLVRLLTGFIMQVLTNLAQKY
jgi:hypothetical protein